MSKSRPGPRLICALQLIRDHPESMAWPGTFATYFWPKDFTSPTTGHRLHAQRNKVNAPMSSWWAAGYLGRLRKAGYIGGGYYDSSSFYSGVSRREPLWLTERALAVLADVENRAKGGPVSATMQS